MLKSARFLLTLGSALVAVGLVACSTQPPTPEEARQEDVPSSWGQLDAALSVTSADGMVTSGHPLASQVGADVLSRGGNAIDATVAVGFALAVVLPGAGNIGGGGFLVYRDDDGGVETLDFREKAPLAAHRDMYLDDRGNLTDKSVLGPLAAGVPGSVAGLWEMHQRHGSLPWDELVAPSIELARGHLIDAVRASGLRYAAEQFALFEASAAQFLPGGEPPEEGDRWQQPALAATLETIQTTGRDGFYRGWVADALVEYMEASEGIITHEDLELYEPIWREPIEIEYRGHTIYSMPPPSSGGLVMGLMLNILSGFDELPPFGSADMIHLEVEAMRRAFVERNRFLGDPDFVELPLERLQSMEYAKQMREEIDLERASPTAPFEELAESTDTTHYSVVDAAGNAASVTTTLNSGYGSKATVPRAGFLLNNEMDDFAAAPGKPNQFGLVEGEANAIVPEKRMLSSMTPSIVIDSEGQLRLVVGSPGGPTIITSVYHVVSNVLDHGMTLKQAVESPRIHHQAWPDRIFVEQGGMGDVARRVLEWRGHEISERDGYSGDIAAIDVSPEGFTGVADPRRGGGSSGATIEQGSALEEAAGF